MNYSQLSSRDEDALFEYINGENDALTLETPASDNCYYLSGWHETKAKLASGELTNEMTKRDLGEEKYNLEIF
ncbi:hypothetical protein [Pleurocapsa sp. FMAR1]|uniref:hypothetical protein n=1 Tax=Pleurocapsa sp. FMAR1 TaxID=3040204 RepID=UPI0029C8B3EB|nr:hypothetical protein [Pleurocapsa sp. FMAR1]